MDLFLKKKKFETNLFSFQDIIIVLREKAADVVT